jgi:hypothetical protein
LGGAGFRGFTRLIFWLETHENWYTNPLDRFASLAKELVVMGGYVDVNLLQVSFVPNPPLTHTN